MTTGGCVADPFRVAVAVKNGATDSSKCLRANSLRLDYPPPRTDQARVVAMPTTMGYTLLISVHKSARFIEALRRMSRSGRG